MLRDSHAEVRGYWGYRQVDADWLIICPDGKGQHILGGMWVMLPEECDKRGCMCELLFERHRTGDQVLLEWWNRRRRVLANGLRRRWVSNRHNREAVRA